MVGRARARERRRSSWLGCQTAFQFFQFGRATAILLTRIRSSCLILAVTSYQKVVFRKLEAGQRETQRTRAPNGGPTRLVAVIKSAPGWSASFLLACSSTSGPS